MRGTDPKPDVTLKWCGGMRLMSVEDPAFPGATFTSVVSMSVHSSPLKPQLPVVGFQREREIGVIRNTSC